MATSLVHNGQRIFTEENREGFRACDYCSAEIFPDDSIYIVDGIAECCSATCASKVARVAE